MGDTNYESMMEHLEACKQAGIAGVKMYWDYDKYISQCEEALAAVMLFIEKEKKENA